MVFLAQRAEQVMVRNEDEDLVEQFRSGDRAAFDELVKRYQRPIYYLARRYVRDDDEAKDLAQRAFVKAYQGIGSLRGTGAFKTWLYRIVSNLALNHIRDHARERPAEEAGDVTIDAVGTARLDDREQHAALRRAIEHLPPKQRQVLELRIYDELSFREVAEVAGCSENAAKVNFHHAVKRLRQVIEEGT